MMRRMEEALSAAFAWEPVVSLIALLLGWVVGAWQWFSGKKPIRQLEKKLNDSEERAEARHREIVDLRKVMANLKFKRIDDTHSYAELPPGARLVKSADGPDRLVLPIALSATFSGKLEGRLSASVIKVPASAQGKPDEG